jgi:hypothetical protein
MLQECNGERERPKPRNVAFSIPLTASENPSRAAVYWVPFSIVTVCWCRSADVAGLGTRRLESGAKEDRGSGELFHLTPRKILRGSTVSVCVCVCVLWDKSWVSRVPCKGKAGNNYCSKAENLAFREERQAGETGDVRW